MRKRAYILLAASALLLVFSTVGSTRAALTYYSENYAAEVTVSSIGISLTENGKIVSHRDYTHSDDKWHETTGELLQNLGKARTRKVLSRKDWSDQQRYN